MLIIGNSRNINCFGEFANRDLEKEFFEHSMIDSMGYIKSIVLVLGLLKSL